MQGNIVVERSVYTSRSDPIGYCPKAEHPERPADRKSEECSRSERHTEHCDLSSTKTAGKAVALQAGHNGAERNNH